MDHAVDLLASRVFAVVAGRDHHHHACINQAAHGAADGIIYVRVNGGRAQTHVDDADVVGRLVGEHPVQSGERARDHAHALRVQHAQVNQVCVWRNSNVGGVRNPTITSGDRGDVRVVTIGIVSSIFASEVLTEDDT